MGIINMGVPEKDALYIKEKYNINHFVETGTYHGGTTAWAATYFDKVSTVEFSKEIYQDTSKKLSDLENVEFIFGDSRQVLPTIVEESTESILFWLDAHWCSGASYGETDQCPLIEELRIINSSSQTHFILVDDARLFTAPPPLPNLIKYYPDLIQIEKELKNQFILIFEDVIYIIPNQYKGDFNAFMQQRTTKQWQDYGKSLQEKESEKQDNRTKTQKTKNLVGDILRTWNLR